VSRDETQEILRETIRKGGAGTRRGYPPSPQGRAQAGSARRAPPRSKSKERAARQAALATAVRGLDRAGRLAGQPICSGCTTGRADEDALAKLKHGDATWSEWRGIGPTPAALLPRPENGLQSPHVCLRRSEGACSVALSCRPIPDQGP